MIPRSCSSIAARAVLSAASRARGASAASSAAAARSAAVQTVLRCGSARLSSSSPPSTSPPSTSSRKFWRELYKDEQDVFTLPDVNENLVTHLHELIPELGSEEGKARLEASPSLPRVLVPGCGRDISMTYLCKRGMAVIGVDFVAEPLRQLGNESGGLTPVLEGDGYMAYQTGAHRSLILLHGDILALPVPDTFGGTVDAAWDRASLTSIDEGDRAHYVAQLFRALRPGGRLLLEFLTCNLPMPGALDVDGTVRLLARAGFTGVRQLQRVDARPLYPAFAPAGLAFLDEVLVVAERPSQEGGEGDVSGEGTGEKAASAPAPS
jgi:SAM-dependent methyltransferase